ncbi:glutaredoxin [Moniliophthora roreri MCA 2997]|uniref:Glutaredoxin n=1 Tax=Moniliophthora roreri (strain MCA 2997) TaxID=1381753 RepID=V2XA93_MONRO|nr:glutaredoxin [Moniliophthora roreri MCA 2997]
MFSRIYTSVSRLLSSSSSSQSPARAMAVKDLVESAIQDNKVTVFSKSYCPYCKSAKSLLRTNFPGVSVKVFELDELDEGSDIQSYLAEKTGQRTVPNIFINKQHIGGNDAVQALHKKAGLAPLVNA